MRLSLLPPLATAGLSGSAAAIALSFAALAALAAPPPTAPPAAAPRVPVLLELFTSEGCSSCPPADLVLARLAEGQPVPGVEVLALSEHVDYWNRLGWADPYSSAQFSQRQEAYATRVSGGRVYTPQAVVDGVVDLVGSNETGLRRALAAAAERPRGTLILSGREGARAAATPPTGTAAAQSIAASIALLVEARGLPTDGDLLVALVEDGLTSRVTAGENEGRTLPHAAVVRSLRRLGRSSGGAAREEVTLAIDPAWRRAGLRAVAFVQEPGGPVLAAGGLALERAK